MRTIKGFTFVEITVVVCIIAVVSSVAIPAIDNFMSSQKVSAEAELFVSSVREARYKAMQENALHRLVFDEDKDGNVSGYKIQIFKNYDSDTEERYGDDDEIDTERGDEDNTERTNPVNFKEIITDYNNLASWSSIIDTDEVVISNDILLKHEPVSVSQYPIYFYPSGYLVRAIAKYKTTETDKKENITDGNYSIISEETLTFSYGNAKVIVHFNAMGILSSELLMEDEDEAKGDEE